MKTVVHYTDSSAFGGAEKMILETLTRLDRRRWFPVLLHHSDPELAPLPAKARELDIKTHDVPRMHGMKGLLQLPRFARWLKRERPAVFHVHLTWPLSGTIALLASAACRVPVVVATAHLYVELPKGLLFQIQPRLVSHAVHRYLAVSEATAQKLRSPLRVPDRKIQVVRNGISVNQYDRPADTLLLAQLSGGTDRPIVLMAARLAAIKGHRYLIDAATAVPDAVFVLAGHGPERAALEKQAQALGVHQRIVFLGYRDDIADLLACCDVFVLPSLAEGLPISILEAMASGLPVIASDIEGNSEAVVHGDTGILVPPENPVALADAIRRILSDKPLRERMGHASKVRARKEFSAERMVQDITRVYNELIAIGKRKKRNY